MIVDTVFCATGRRPVTDALHLENAGVIYDSVTNKIETVNEQTNVSHIYAVGDVLKDKPELTPSAIHAGKLLARRIFGTSTQNMDYNNIATTVFTPTEYSSVGLSEEKALSLHNVSELEVYYANYSPIESFLPQKNTRNFSLKVIALKHPPKTVLGLHFVGMNAGEVIQGFSAAIKCGLTMDTLLNTVGIHPTTAEEFMKVNKTNLKTLTELT